MEPSAATVLSLLGVVLTLILGVTGVVLTIRSRFKPAITYYQQGVLALFEEIAQSVEGLEILHHKQPISKSLVLLKGAIINTGGRDIASYMVEAKLRARLRSGCRWLELQCSQGAETSIEVHLRSPEIVEFDLGLFRVGDFVQFRAAIELDNVGTSPAETTKILKRSLSFHHGIADTGSVRRLSGTPEPFWAEMIAYLCTFSGFMALLLSATLLLHPPPTGRHLIFDLAIAGRQGQYMLSVEDGRLEAEDVQTGEALHPDIRNLQVRGLTVGEVLHRKERAALFAVVLGALASALLLIGITFLLYWRRKVRFWRQKGLDLRYLASSKQEPEVTPGPF